MTFKQLNCVSVSITVFVDDTQECLSIVVMVYPRTVYPRKCVFKAVYHRALCTLCLYLKKKKTTYKLYVSLR